MKKISVAEGSDLMREWGVPSWTNVEGDYYLWKDCCVVVAIERGDYIEGHMAMDKTQRARCRDAGYDILAVIGHRMILAPILPESKHVANYLSRMGFETIGNEVATLVDGREVDLTFMFRLENGRSN